MDRALAQGIAYARGISTAAHREPVDLAALARADTEGHTLEGARVTCELPKTPVLVQADRVALARVIANLTGNALKYGTKAALRLTANGRFAELIVDDDGPGIPANLRQLVFEPFFRADEARTNPSLGTGLGLAVARDIVMAHGGTITVGDAPGGGARMTVRLPLA
jgi:signal transduction histidine kinase